MSLTPESLSNMRENEIRPDELLAGQTERYLGDVKRLLARRNEFVEVPCPACRSRSAKPAFVKYELNYQRCDDCRTLYISPRPTPAVLDEYYRTSENYRYWNRYIFPASEVARREKIFRPRVERLIELCRRWNVGRRLLVEVGSGFGTFCDELGKSAEFARIIAVEPTPDLAATCRQRGLEVIESSVEDVIFPADTTVDVIASFEVIEHLFNPGAFLRQFHRLLAPGGVVVLTCPNGEGFDIQTLGPLSDAVDTEHLNYFNPDSLTYLLNSCGFDVLEIQTPGKLDAELVRKKALSGVFEIETHPFLETVLVNKWDRVGGAFQQFLAVNLLSSHLWIVARKGEPTAGSM